ncbi:unnamed protein product [Amoebophrya sp. A120]|nr:unnamed protein product [Amoebophrya sp. A120]|eukprot:GSA120T00024480001.1
MVEKEKALVTLAYASAAMCATAAGGAVGTAAGAGASAARAVYQDSTGQRSLVVERTAFAKCTNSAAALPFTFSTHINDSEAVAEAKAEKYAVDEEICRGSGSFESCELCPKS